MVNTLNSTFIDETRTNEANSGYSMAVRGFQVETDETVQGAGVDGRLIVGSRSNPAFEANSSGIRVGKLMANGSLGINNYVLRSNGNTVFWGAVSSGGSGSQSNVFTEIKVSGQPTIYADGPNDSLTFIQGFGITITSHSANDSIRMNVSNVIVSNSYFQTKLANTNAYVASRATWASLTSTNTALRTLISDRLQVSNATTLLNTRATWSALTSTNTALRTLISDRLQVANAITLLNTRATWASLTSTNTALRTLINDRLQVSNATTLLNTRATWTSLTSTNTALRTLISDRLQVANATTLYATRTNPTTSGLLAHTGRVTVSTNLTVSGNTTLGGAGRTQTSTGAWAHTGTQSVSTNLTVSGNTTLGGAGRTQTSTGAWAHTGRVTVSTNLTVSGNVSGNKIYSTNHLRSSGNTFIGDPGRTSVVTGVLTANGRATVSTNLTVSGNTTLGAAGRTQTSTGAWSHTGTQSVSTNLTVSGNTTLGAAGRTQTSTGAWSHTGRVTISTNLTVSGNTTYAVMIGPNSSTRDKIRFHDTTPYSLGFQASITFGPLNDWAFTTQMNDTSTRGFWWGQSNHTTAQGAMALDTDGNLYLARRLRVGYGESDTTDVASWNCVTGLDVSGTARISGNTVVNALVVGTTGVMGSNGTIRATNDITAYYSDDRLKIRYGNIPNALGKICNLNGFYFQANETAQKLGYEVKREVGVSAQEMQAVLPEVVVPAPIDENYLTVKYEKVVPLLIEAIKELNNQIVELKKEVEILKSTNYK